MKLVGLFSLHQISDSSSEIIVSKSLKGRHGNYTLIIQAEDLGFPPRSIEREVFICVTDFNDHPPVFVSPPHNTTLRIPEVRHHINVL